MVLLPLLQCSKLMRRLLSVIVSSVSLMGCSFGSRPESRERMLRVKGSDTMVILMSVMAERYMQRHQDVRVSVTGGGTRSGIASMINGTCDIVAASRDVTKEELELTKKNGLTPKKLVIAKDAIAIIVNPSNPLRSATLEDLGKIFSGRAANWNELGAGNEPIIVYSRESSSGTFRYMQSQVLHDRDFGKQARFMSSNTSIVDSVSQERSAIGYVSYGHARASKSVKCLPIKVQPVEIISPTIDNLKSGRYPLSRDLLLYINSDRKLVRSFANFCLSEEGQKTAVEYGYVPIDSKTAAVAAL
jgi:phosphate transport system substrate-binding protein